MERRVTNISELYPNFKGTYDVITIGDSFSNQAASGYQDYLINNDLSVLNIDFGLLGQNPIQALLLLLNGGFFEDVKSRYVVLECAERFVIDRCNELQFAESVSALALKEKVKARVSRKAEKIHTNSEIKPVRFFSRNTLQIPLINILYLFQERPRKAVVYKGVVTGELFSVKSNRVLFYNKDYKGIVSKNDRDKARMVVESINALSEKLAQKDITLLFLIAPDKYDMYYPYLHHTERYERPLFFDHYSGFRKKYIDIPAYSILNKAIHSGVRDVYYYDDTHWSPKASQYVADEIYRLLRTNQGE